MGLAFDEEDDEILALSHFIATVRAIERAIPWLAIALLAAAVMFGGAVLSSHTK
jgi:hypothetical protein